jgi:hypothetical protein
MLLARVVAFILAAGAVIAFSQRLWAVFGVLVVLVVVISVVFKIPPGRGGG